MIRPSLQVVMSAPGERGERRMVSSGVSERPRAGSRYAPAETVSRESHWWRDFGAVPGGRKLWCRLVTAFTFVSLFGVGFIFLGAAFVHQAHKIYKDSGLSLPLTWCVIGIGECLISHHRIVIIPGLMAVEPRKAGSIHPNEVVGRRGSTVFYFLTNGLLCVYCVCIPVIKMLRSSQKRRHLFRGDIYSRAMLFDVVL